MDEKLNLLVIGLDPDLLDLVTHSLQGSCSRVESVDVRDGLSRALRLGEWDAFVVARTLDACDLAAVVGQLRSAAPGSRVIVVSRASDDAAAANLRGIDADEHLIADLPDRFADSLGRALGNCRMQRELRQLRAVLQESDSRLECARDALAASESRANLILDLVPEAMLLIDATGCIQRANLRAAKVFGYPPGKLHGMPLEALIPQRLRAVHRTHVAAFAANPQPRQMGVGRELVALRSDGAEFPVEASLGPAQIDGRSHVIVTLVDITERRRAAIELQRFEQIVRTSPDMLAYVDRDLRYQVVNPAYAMQVGGLPEDLAGRRIREVLPPEVWHDIEPILLRALAGEELSFSSRRVFADGEEHVLDATYRPFVVDGNVTGIVVSHRDVTGRVRAEAAAARESRRNQILLRNASDGIAILDESGRVIEASDSFCDALLYTREEVIGASLSLWDARWSEDDLGEILARAIHDSSRRQFETLYRRKDGTTFEVEVTSITVDVEGRPVVFCSTRDISQRRAVERALSESQAVIERAQQMAHLGSWTYDFANDQVFLSAEHQRILIWPSNICSGAELKALVHPDDAARIAGTWRHCFVSGEPMDVEYRVVIKGVVKHLHVRGEMRLDDRGRVQSAIGFTQDVTTLREAERALEAHASHLEDEVAARTAALAVAEAKFRGLVEQSFAAIDIYQDGYFRYVNPAFARIFGFDGPEQIVDRVRSLDLIAPECRERVLENLRLRSTGEVESIQYEFVGLRRDGSRIDLEVFGRHFDYDGRPATIGIVIDITQRKLAEQAQSRALAEAERLAQVRRDFLANMSHEIRTPLSAILGLAQVGMREDSGRRSSHTFGRILDSGQLLLGVINDILDFSKIEAGKLDVEALPFDPCEAIDRAVGFVAPQAQSKGLEFVVEEAADLPARCAGDKLRLSQILVNLLSNAVKFTERGTVRLRVVRDADWLRFDVIDSGIGIAADQLERLFCPFEQGDTTTTRRFGGTGLGLTISNRLAGLMAGELTAQSRVGEGSTFTLRMPLQDAVDPARAHESLGIVLAGIGDSLAAELSDALVSRGARASRRTPTAAFEQPADLIVIDGTAFDAAVAARVRQAIACGRRVAVARRGDVQISLDDELRAGVIQIDYPLRARHLIAAVRAGTAASDASSGVSGGARLRGVRVLAAEDNAINREVLTEIMALEGAQLTLAEDGEQAVARLQRDGARAFDVLLTDIQMPGIDGYETARRALALAPDLPVMGLTAHAMRDERERCLAAGMVEHIAKPIDIDALVNAVLRHLRRPDHAPASMAAGAPVTPQAANGAVDVVEPAIDWEALERRFAARPAFVRRLGQMLLQGQSGMPARLRELAACGDYAQIAFVAHTIKGVAGNLMARPAESLARETEAAARGSSPEALQLAMRLAEAIETMFAATRARFPGIETAAAQTVGG